MTWELQLLSCVECYQPTMDLVHLPESHDSTSTDAATTGTSTAGAGTRPMVSKGSDATDILPDDVLKTRVRSCEGFKDNDATPLVTIREEFAQVQRELEAKIERFDRTCEVCYEDAEVIVYRLDKPKDYEYILDYCEVEPAQYREILVELMQTIAAERTDDVVRHPLVVRKPHMFRSGERHALGQLFRVQDRLDDPSK